MRKKQIVVFLLIFSFLSVAGMTLIGPVSAKLPDAPIGFEPMRIGDRIENANYEINLDETPSEPSSSAESSSTYNIMDTKMWLSLDDWNGFYFFDFFERWDVGTSDNTEIWIQIDRSWPDPDPHEPDRAYPEITADQVAQLLLEFDSNIYETVTGYFGTPDHHDGAFSLLEAWGYVPPGYYSSPEGKNVILVSNVQDENYYTDFPYYIAGFYSSTFEGYFDRNIISIDSYQWEERVGPDGARPYLYEGVIAHEYQHLVHADHNPGDPSFMNEGCSMFAEYLSGYGVAWGDINSYMATPDNSLTEWGDQGGINILADYGVALLWAVYLNDRFGPEFLGDFVAAGVPGVAGLELLIAPYSFDEIYRDWRIANLIDSESPGGGRYNYETIDLHGPDADPIRVYEIKKAYPTHVFGTSFGTTITTLGYDTGISEVSAYGSDYINLHNPPVGHFESFFEFDGDDTAGVPSWVLDVDQNGDGDADWYSTTAGDEADLSLLTAVDLTGIANPILAFDTYYDIEPFWDYGFVQVSTDDGATWTSVANAYTTMDHDPDAYPEIIANLPGITGSSGGWINMNFDLSAYTGGILLSFRYMTDWAFNEAGWWIDNVQVLDGEAPVFEVTNFIFPPSPEIDFMVTLIRAEKWRGRTFYSIVCDMTLEDATETGLKWAFPFSYQGADVFVIVSPLVGPADYEFSHYKRLKHSPWGL